MLDYQTMDYEILDHTADVCIRVYGRSFEELLRNAALGLMGLVTDVDKVEPSEAVEIEAEGETREELLVNWLQEILFAHQVKKMLFKDFEISLVKETGIRGKAFGEKIDFEKHELSSDIKAVTHHNLKIEPLNDKLKVEIVFDI